MKIAMLEGYRKPRRRRKALRGHRKTRRRRHMGGGNSAHKKLFGKVAKICLVGKGPRAKKSKCMKIGLTKGVAAAQAFARR